MTILYMNDTFSVGVARMQSANNAGSLASITALFSWQLGKSNKGSYDEHEYWYKIKSAIWRGCAQAEGYRHEQPIVMLQGEAASDQEFQDHVKEALIKYMDYVSVIDVTDPGYIAARGAAIIAMHAGI